VAKPIRAADVFTPGSFPTHTYVDRAERNPEPDLRRGLETRGQIISLAGPSKSGKTVLVERVVGRENLIPLTGGSIRTADDVWNRALDWMGEPDEQSSDQETSSSGTLSVDAKGGASLIGLVKAEVGTEAALESGSRRGQSKTVRRRGMQQVVTEVAGSDFVLLIDDFHYIPRDVQAQVAQQLKEAARQEVKIIVVAVPHRSDDVIRANSDLRGRVHTIDLSYWKDPDLTKIADLGFHALNGDVDRESIELFAQEAAGSPQLMQSVCLNACYAMELDERRPTPARFQLRQDQRHRILQNTASFTDYRTLVTILDTGPKARGTERKTYQFGNGEEGDVYTAILRAIASDPPRLSLDYDKINKRVAKVCIGEGPGGSSIVESCFQMAKLAGKKVPTQRVLDWDKEKQVLDVADPYLLFYLRWSGYKVL
jgi:hypothetical protein